MRLVAKLVEPVVDVVTRLEDPQSGGVVHGECTGGNPQNPQYSWKDKNQSMRRCTCCWIRVDLHNQLNSTTTYEVKAPVRRKSTMSLIEDGSIRI